MLVAKLLLLCTSGFWSDVCFGKLWHDSAYSSFGMGDYAMMYMNNYFMNVILHLTCLIFSFWSISRSPPGLEDVYFLRL